MDAVAIGSLRGILPRGVGETDSHEGNGWGVGVPLARLDPFGVCIDGRSPASVIQVKYQ